jgi:hypothetical protein
VCQKEVVVVSVCVLMCSVSERSEVVVVSVCMLMCSVSERREVLVLSVCVLMLPSARPSVGSNYALTQILNYTMQIPRFSWRALLAEYILFVVMY